MLLVIPASTRPAHAQFIGTVCIDPAIAQATAPAGCSTAPVKLGGTSLTVGSTFSLEVDVAGSDTTNGFEVAVMTDPNVLLPLSANITGAGTLVNILGSPLTLVNCINNGVGGRAPYCVRGIHALGVALVVVPALGGVYNPSTTGRLMYVNYQVKSLTTGSPIVYVQNADPTICGASSHSPDCVFISNGGGGFDPENVQTATFANQAAAPSVTLVASPSPSEVGTLVTFTATATGGTPPYVSFSWNFGDGSPAGSGVSTTHTYASAGTFSVTVTVTDSAAATGTSPAVSLVVNAKLAVSAAASPNPTEVGTVVSLTGTTSGGVGAATCSWNFGDGSPAGSGCSTTHTYATNVGSPFTATVTATDTLGVTATASVSVTINAKLAVVTVTGSPNPQLVVTGPITFTATTSGGVGAVTCSWNFGDGSPAGSGCSTTHTYAAANTYTVTVTATDSLAVTATGSVSEIVGSALAVVLTVSPTTTEVGFVTTFTAAPSGGTPPYTSYSWVFGDGMTATTTTASTTHAYASTGSFSATVTVTDSAAKTATSPSVSVTVNAKLAVTAAASPNPTDATVSVSFTAPTSGGVGAATCSWAFGDGCTASTCSSTHSSYDAGSFTSTIMATDAPACTPSAASLVTLQHVAIVV